MSAPRTCLFIVGLLLAASTSVGDEVATAMARIAPGDTLAWRTVDDDEGRGIVAGVSGTSIELRAGVTIDARRCRQLWRRTWSRATSFRRAATGGFLVGSVTGLALYNTHKRDDGGLQDLGASLGAALTVALGTLGGMAVGAASPPAGAWEPLIGLPPNHRPAPGPDEFLGARPPTPHLGIGLQGSIAGWNSTGDDLLAGTLAFWYPLGHTAAVGLQVGAGRSPAMDGHPDWADTGHVSLSGEARIALRPGDGIVPYIGIGGGRFAEIGDTAGVRFAAGLRSRALGRTRLRLEIGSLTSFELIADDKPGAAYASIQAEFALGSPDDRR